MERLKQLIHVLHRDIGDGPVVNYCVRVMEYIAQRQGFPELLLTYSTIAEIMHVPQESAYVTRVANILSNEDIHVLVPEMRVRTRDGLSQRVPLDLLKEYFEVGELADPISGLLYDDPERHLLPTFRATPEWLKQDVAGD